MSVKLEHKVLLSLVKLMANESIVLNRWRIGGRILSILGWAAVVYSLFKCFELPLLPRGFVLLGILGGACAVLGMWFSSFAVQWPVVASFLDRQAIVARASESQA